jgi:hypothetical protein
MVLGFEKRLLTDGLLDRKHILVAARFQRKQKRNAAAPEMPAFGAGAMR